MFVIDLRFVYLLVYLIILFELYFFFKVGMLISYKTAHWYNIGILLYWYWLIGNMV